MRNFACCLLGLAVMPALAANLTISPTTVELTAAQKVRSLQLQNMGATPIAMELAVKRWSMADGQWRLEDIAGPGELLVHPLSFKIAPGKSQVIRVGLLRPPAPGPEVAYRLYLRELPGEAGEAKGASLGVLTQFSLPVFISSRAGKAEASVVPGDIKGGTWTFQWRAGTDRHIAPAKASLRLLGADGATMSTQDLSLGYVLAGATLPVTVKLDPAACQSAARYELVMPRSNEVLSGELTASARTCRD